MRTLSLTAADQAQIAETIRVLSSPFEFSQREEWLRQAGDAAVSLLGGSMYMFMFPDTSGVSSVDGTSLGKAGFEQYRQFEPQLQDAGYFERVLQLPVGTRREAYGPHYPDITQSAYVQEFLRAYDIGESLFLCVPLSPRPRRQNDIVQFTVNKEFGEEPFSDESVQKARIIYPSLRAGFQCWRRLAHVRESMSTMLDAAGGACAVLDIDGRLLHCTPALDAALSREPRRDQLMSCVRRIVKTFGSNDVGGAWGDSMAGVQFIGIRGCYTLAPSRLVLVDRPCILVSIEPPARSQFLPQEDALRERYGLTGQEARVVLQLAQRRTNREIADALFISVHTARHHVSHALEKLGVKRRDVRAYICRSFESSDCVERAFRPRLAEPASPCPFPRRPSASSPESSRRCSAR